MMRTADVTEWDEEMKAKLRRYWAVPSMTTEDIGREIGASKNAVIGKARRLGLANRKRMRKTLAESDDRKPLSAHLAACPCCGQAVEGAATIEGLEFIPLPKVARRIVSTLIEKYPSGVSADRLAEAVYWDDPNGGPGNARNSIAVTIHRIRPLLESVGWNIGVKGGKGTGIRLMPMEEMDK